MADTVTDRRVIIYPTYLNKKRTRAEGRRISAEKGCEDPLATEIYDVVKFLKLPCEIELNKSYSREWWLQGRVRVMLKNEEGTPIIDSIPSRKALFVEVSRLVPRHPNRQPKPAEKEKGDTGGKGGGKHQGGKKGGKKGKK